MIDILGYVAGILIVISLLPQAIKSWKTKSTKDISLARYIIYVAGLVLWITYAVIINNGPVAVMNGIGLVLAVSILYLKLKMDSRAKNKLTPLRSVPRCALLLSVAWGRCALPSVEGN